jgi:hypothetical protein
MTLGRIARGLTYFTGRLGDSKLVAFRESETADKELYGAEARWRVFLQAFEAPPT